MLAVALACAWIAACGPQHASPTATARATLHATAHASAAPSQPGTTATPAAAPTQTPGDFGGTAEGLSFSWAPGYTPPPWLPAFIARAPAAPSGGSPVCGADPARGLYTALIRYDPTSAAGAVTVQIQGFHGSGAYANSGAAAPVDVEVSPPTPSAAGLSGFGASGATALVNADLTSGTLTSPLMSGTRQVGTISGAWRCA